MHLFHYHWWTDNPEKMETFYQQSGFETTLRVGHHNGEMHTFNPPLNWEDFRDKDIRYRIIEMVKGQTNLTFGHGKKDMFDHIGFLVTDAENSKVIERAEELKWKVNEGERRTFISTPWKFRIELQKRQEVVTEKKHPSIQAMEIHMPFREDPALVSSLLNFELTEQTSGKVTIGNDECTLIFCNSEGKEPSLHSVVYLADQDFSKVDPVHMKLIGRTHKWNQ
ncbi:MAG: VOC family protein [Bacillota bacterium]